MAPRDYPHLLLPRLLLVLRRRRFDLLLSLLLRLTLQMLLHKCLDLAGGFLRRRSRLRSRLRLRSFPPPPGKAWIQIRYLSSGNGPIPPPPPAARVLARSRSRKRSRPCRAVANVLMLSPTTFEGRARDFQVPFRRSRGCSTTPALALHVLSLASHAQDEAGGHGKHQGTLSSIPSMTTCPEFIASSALRGKLLDACFQRRVWHPLTSSPLCSFRRREANLTRAAPALPTRIAAVAVQQAFGGSSSGFCRFPM